jgi:hypothetical protein
MRCSKPLDSREHGNRKSHKDCAYSYKKLHQKEKYKVGNSVKLMIQKNAAVAKKLYKLDALKCGIPYLEAMEYGLKFSCPSTIREHLNKKVYFFDQYGFTIETINGDNLIFIYHETDLH